MNSPAVLIENLSVSIDSKPILTDINFSIARGEMVTIIGPNGAGKSTLLRCIGGLETRYSGLISISGQPIRSYPRKELAKQISYVPQSSERGLPYSVREFILMSRYPHFKGFFTVSADDRRAVDDSIESSGLAALADRRIDSLSGGERQKVFIAAAVAQGASIVLLDEPTTFLDYRCAAEVMDLMIRLNHTENLTVISVTHDVNQGVSGSHRVLGLKSGCVAFSGTPVELMSPDTLERIYDLPFQTIANPLDGRSVVFPKGTGR